jgi:hypothetical protein
MSEKNHDYFHLKLYTQEDLDTIKAQVKIGAQMEQFVIDESGNPDISKIKQIAQFLELSIEKYGDSLPHEAALASELVDTALKMLIKALP